MFAVLLALLPVFFLAFLVVLLALFVFLLFLLIPFLVALIAFVPFTATTLTNVIAVPQVRTHCMLGDFDRVAPALVPPRLVTNLYAVATLYFLAGIVLRAPPSASRSFASTAESTMLAIVIVVSVAVVIAARIASQIDIPVENILDHGQSVAECDLAISVHIAHFQRTILGVRDGRQDVQNVSDHGVIARTSWLATVAVIGENRSGRGQCQ
jgi:hypothetical protein